MTALTVGDFRTSLTAMKPELQKALPPHVSVERFERVTMTALQTNPKLLQADRRTLFGAVTKAAQQGLLPDGREGAIVQFKDQAQWMPMVAGIMKLVRNSGEISTWSVQAVFDNDEFDYCLGDDEKITHRPALKDRGAFKLVYSIVNMKDGEKSREVMTKEEVDAIRKRSRSGSSGPWESDYAEMAKKTVIRRHSKRLPMSTDLDGLVHSDDDLFMPDEPAAAQGDKPAPARTRPSRLDKVAQQAPAQAEQIITDDGEVIDAEATVVEDEDIPI